MSATQLLFQHELINGGAPLIVETGADEISWAYTLNTVGFPTYGGEVVQILSVYIDDLTVKGTVRSYAKLEAIYSFFMKYFTVATQGSTAASADKYTQVPMTMEYAHRGWRFEIQPLEAPGFAYATETVAPQWEIKAHMVDQTPNAAKLKDLVAQQLINGDNFALKGVISPESGDPSQNPFIAPGTYLGDVFVEATAKQAAEGVTKIGDYYNSLLPSYLDNSFFQTLTAVGAKPAFGNETGGTPNSGGSTTKLPGAKLPSGK
jgi:hypothetical protein